MPIVLYNTLARRRETFEPIDPAHVRMYVCGPTVYSYAHIGNARPVVVFDVLYRLLKASYPKVTYVRNITDIDDKIIEAARASGETIAEVTERTGRAYHEDMAALGALKPDMEPRATHHVGQMIAMIERLVALGHAYVVEGHVLFSVPSMDDYGQLSGRNRDEQIAGARVDVAPYKRDPADFVLWKPSTAEQPGWESPWGRGRPGWHIECSAMSEVHLGKTFDIHGGGIDLVFPHHENEIAQGRCAHGTPYMARYWLHNGYLMAEGEKMSKSLGNFYTVHDLLEEFPGEALRLVLLSAHYRQPLDFTKDGVRAAKAGLDRLYGALRQVPGDTSTRQTPDGIRAALEDDLNTPAALAELHELAGLLNKSGSDAARTEAASALRAGGAALGLLRQDPEAWFRWTAKGREGGLSDSEIEALIQRRRAARAARNWAEADRLRDELTTAGILLEDSAGGTQWKRAG